MPITDKVTKANNGVLALPATLATNKGTGVTTADLNANTGWPQDSTDGPVHFALFKVDVGTNTLVSGTLTFWKATLSGNTLSNMQLTGGLNQNYVIGDSALITSTPGYINDLVDAFLTQHTRTGAHKDITATSLTTTGDVSVGGNQTTTGNMTINGTLTVAGSSSAGGWTPISGTITSVTYNGNGSYTLGTSADNTASIPVGAKGRSARTVAAPVQCALFNGSNNYLSKASPNGMTFTDDFAAGKYVYLTSYPAVGFAYILQSRMNGTSGWTLYVMATGQIVLEAYNGGTANYSNVKSNQSVPLGRVVHIAAQLDMSAFTATPTTSYVMFDGQDVPATVSRSGTNPTSLVQAGNYEIGSQNGGVFPLTGRMAQPFVTSAKVSQSNMRTIYSQGITPSDVTALNMVSAYTLSNSLTDLNTTNNNTLTNNNSTNIAYAFAPWGGQAGGSISATYDHFTYMAVTPSSLTVQAANGCTIPTSGGVSALSYATVSSPYGFPNQKGKFQLLTVFRNTAAQASPGFTTYNLGGMQLVAPVGTWRPSSKMTLLQGFSSPGNQQISVAVATANNTMTPIDYGLASSQYANISATSSNIFAQTHTMLATQDYIVSTPTTLYVNEQATGGNNLEVRGDMAECILALDNTYI